PPSGTRSATPTTIDFGAIFPFTAVPAYNLPVYASQWPLPDTTQDSVRGCWLSFAAAAIPGDWVTCAFKAQPAQIRGCCKKQISQAWLTESKEAATHYPSPRSSGLCDDHSRA